MSLDVARVPANRYQDKSPSIASAGDLLPWGLGHPIACAGAGQNAGFATAANAVEAIQGSVTVTMSAVVLIPHAL